MDKCLCSICRKLTSKYDINYRITLYDGNKRFGRRHEDVCFSCYEKIKYFIEDMKQ